jgi:hypothetical protein
MIRATVRAGVLLAWKGSRVNYIAIASEIRATSMAMAAGGSIFARGGKAEAADTGVDLDARKSDGGEAFGDVGAIDGDEDAADMDHTVQQIVFDFECEERTAGTQDAECFAKGVFLGGARAEMVQHQDSDGGRKGALPERKRCGVSLHDCISISRCDACCEWVTPFEARHARSESLQCFCAGPGSCAQLEHMISERGPSHDPRQQMIARDALPETRRAKPIFECVQCPSPITGAIIC